MTKEQQQANIRMRKINSEREKAIERQAERAQKKEKSDLKALLMREGMMFKLRISFGEVVNYAIDGSFFIWVVNDFEDESLNDLSYNINNLLATVDDQ